MMEFDLRQLIRSIRHRFWIVLLLVFLAGAGGYAGASLQRAQFTASATMLIAPPAQDGTQIISLQSSIGIAETYRMLIETGPVLDQVVSELELPFGIDELEEKVTTTSVSDTLLVRVTVVDTDADRTALIANTIVNVFQRDIVGQIDPQLGAQVEMVNPARAPSAPFAPNIVRSVVLGAFVGLILAIGVVALMEISDNTVKQDLDFVSLFGAPLLAAVPTAESVKNGNDSLFVLRQPRSTASEVVRLLRTNLEFAGATLPVRSLTVTSPGPGEGKSTVSANLAVAMAQAGFRTVLIDADLRSPTQHRIFGLSNRKGLTNLLMHPELAWRTIADPIRAAAGLFVLSSGPLPPNPSDLLQSSRYADLLQTIGRDADLLIIDTPPALAVSDPLTAARRTDGIVVVCRTGKTRLEALRHVSSAIAQGNIRFIGIVLNEARSRHPDYYGNYHSDEVETAPVSVDDAPPAVSVPISAARPTAVT